MSPRRWNGNTLGAANDGVRLVGDAKNAWEAHYLAQPVWQKKIKPAREVPTEQQAILEWLKKEHEPFDIALTLHWSNDYWYRNPRYRPTQVEPSDAYRNDMRHYLNILDRELFGSAHRRYGKRFNRLMALQRSPGVGWHAHAVLRTPEHIEQPAFIRLLEAHWRRHLGGSATRSNIDDRLFQGEENQGNFAGYSIRYEQGKELATHWNNIGIIDWHNTALPSP